MSLDLALTVARSGLRLLDRQMARTADDIANAGTAGHTRKSLGGNAVNANGTGIGVRSQVPTREVELAMIAAADRARGDAAAGDLRLRLLSGVEAAHGRPEDGDSLGGLMSRLHADLIALREAPADATRRSTVVEAADNLAARFNGVAGAVADARQEAHDQLRREAGAANGALAEIATLTAEIRRETIAGRGAAALEDKRDLAIARLSESLEVRAIHRGNGDITLVARGGVVLPTDGSAAFSVAPANVGTGAYHGGAGTLPGLLLMGQDVTRQVAGGRLAAAAELRDATLPRMQAELDLAAANLAYRFEQQGLRLFTDAAGNVPDVTLPYAGGPMLGFSAAIQVNAAVAADPALLRDGTHAVTAAPAGPTAFVPNPANGPAGFAVLIDRLLDHAFGPTVAPGVAQPAIVAAGLGPDGTLVSSLSGLNTLEGHAAALVSEHGAARARAEEAQQRAGAFRDMMGERIAERSGVDVDKEVAAMVQLQTAYGVNARVVSTVQAMWDALFGAVR
jgi:flagellar hook-associated protein 1 FlgK